MEKKESCSTSIIVKSDSHTTDFESSSITSVEHKTPHDEPHFGSADIIRDIVIGLSDGLTVPFALAAGLATLKNSQLVVTAGMAEVVAGSISMGLGGFMAGLTEIEHYDCERAREMHEVETVPERELQEIVEIFEPFGLFKSDIQPMLDKLQLNKESWVDFMMTFELSLERPSKFRSWVSALTIGISYFLGGLIPLIPYIFLRDARDALFVSIAATISALLIFGFVKAKFLGTPRPVVSAIQMAIVGAAAAAVAFGVAKAIPMPDISHN